MARQSSRSLWADKLSGKTADSNALLKVKPGAKKSGKALPTALNAPAQFAGTVLGIDPSLRGTGLAVIELKRGCKPKYKKSLTVKNAPSLTLAECIKNIFNAVDGIMCEFDIDCAAIEQSIYVQNNKVSMLLGSARGAALAAVARKDVEVFEYPPLRIKQAVVGYGMASKQQVSKTMSAMLDGAPNPFPYDEADAAATALAHAYTRGKTNSFGE